MRRFLIVVGVSIIAAAVTVFALWLGHVFPSGGDAMDQLPSSSPSMAVGVPEGSADMNASAAPGQQTPAGKADILFMRPAEFKEGVWIKKYPGNYACFKFETPDGVKVITDPFNMDETVQPDIVTESHSHSDHADVAKLTAPYELVTRTGDFELKGVGIKGFPGKHDKGKEAESIVIYVYRIGGIRVVQFASQGEVPDQKTLDAIGKVDVLLIQAIEPAISGKLSLQECAQIIAALQPGIVIPEHGASGVSAAFAKYYKVPVEYASPVGIYVTKQALDAVQGIRIIDMDTP